MTSIDLRKKILATICYYDVMEYPLTSFEIWENLINFDKETDVKKVALVDVVNELEENSLRNYIRKEKGFYFLKGKNYLVKKRSRKNKISNIKIKKIRKYIFILSAIPFVRMIGLTGGLSMKKAGIESDWDLLVVLKKGRIWTGRTLVTFITHLLGKRRYRNKIRNRFCLNYFITNESLEVPTKDVFSANEYCFMIPLFCAEKNIYEKFQIKNSWIKSFKPNFSLTQESNLLLIKNNKFSSFVRIAGEKILKIDFLENWLRSWQKKKILNNPLTKKEGSFIHVSDDALVFLPTPQGPSVFEKFRDNISKLV